VLFGPPVERPPVLFLGYQPGGDEEAGAVETERGTHLQWPDQCDYATQDWRLGVVMRQLFEPDIDLRPCCGINAIFVRAPNITAYKAKYDKKARAKITAFCLPRVDRLIDAMRPAKIVVIGLQTLKLFDKHPVPGQRNAKGQALTAIGQVPGGRRAIATLHLTGYRVSRQDSELIKQAVLAFEG
jgi:hypothetical protein